MSERTANIISVFALAAAIIALCLSFSSLQPNIAIIQNPAYNNSTNLTNAEIQFYNNDPRPAVYDFHGSINSYFEMTYYDKTNGMAYYLIIPVSNRYISPFKTSNVNNSLLNLTSKNIHESNIDEGERINQSFSKFAEKQNNTGYLQAFDYVYLTYSGYIVPWDTNEIYYLSQSQTTPTRIISINSNCISKHPVDYMANDANDTLFKKWIDESSDHTNEGYCLESNDLLW